MPVVNQHTQKKSDPDYSECHHRHRSTAMTLCRRFIVRALIGNQLENLSRPELHVLWQTECEHQNVAESCKLNRRRDSELDRVGFRSPRECCAQEGYQNKCDCDLPPRDPEPLRKITATPQHCSAEDALRRDYQDEDQLSWCEQLRGWNEMLIANSGSCPDQLM